MSDAGSQLRSFVPTRRGGISEVEIDGELVLLDTSTGALHVLNPAGAAVWAELNGASSVEQIVSGLSEAAGAETARVREDVTEFLGRLGRAGLLSSSPPSACGDSAANA